LKGRTVTGNTERGNSDAVAETIEQIKEDKMLRFRPTETYAMFVGLDFGVQIIESQLIFQRTNY
jgi:UDP-3-O-acyl-N-acetylglucosamine deacetylase